MSFGKKLINNVIVSVATAVCLKVVEVVTDILLSPEEPEELDAYAQEIANRKGFIITEEDKAKREADEKESTTEMLASEELIRVLTLYTERYKDGEAHNYRVITTNDMLCCLGSDLHLILSKLPAELEARCRNLLTVLDELTTQNVDSREIALAIYKQIDGGLM
jgi:hypothetical protein